MWIGNWQEILKLLQLLEPFSRYVIWMYMSQMELGNCSKSQLCLPLYIQLLSKQDNEMYQTITSYGRCACELRRNAAYPSSTLGNLIAKFIVSLSEAIAEPLVEVSIIKMNYRFPT